MASKAQPSSPLRVLVVEDHPLLAAGIRGLLSARGHTCVGPASTIAEGRELLVAEAIDVALVDLTLPDGSGLELVRAALPHNIPCIVLTAQPGPLYVQEALRAGARGYLFKGEPPGHVADAIDVVSQGGSYLGVHAMDIVAATPGATHEPLSARETEVLKHLASGLTNKQVGKLLNISPRTVETHRENLARKLRVRTVAGLTRVAIAMGLVSSNGD